MCRIAMILLGLLAALAGPPLRLVEGASDCARALAQLDGRSNLSEADGGVGDDQGEMTPSLVASDTSNHGLHASYERPTLESLPLPALADSLSALSHTVPPPDRMPSLAPLVSRRLACLQRFLC